MVPATRYNEAEMWSSLTAAVVHLKRDLQMSESIVGE